MVRGFSRFPDTTALLSCSYAMVGPPLTGESHAPREVSFAAALEFFRISAERMDEGPAASEKSFGESCLPGGCRLGVSDVCDVTILDLAPLDGVELGRGDVIGARGLTELPEKAGKGCDGAVGLAAASVDFF